VCVCVCVIEKYHDIPKVGVISNYNGDESKMNQISN